MRRPQLILDAAGVLVTNLSPDYWNAIHSLTGIPYDQLKALFKNELRDDFWSGKVPEACFWEWLREKAPHIDSAAAQHMLGKYLQPIPAMNQIAGWSQFADIHVLSNHRSEWLARLLEPVRPYVKSMTISSAVGVCKPDPEIYKIVHASLNKRQPIFYLDDQEKNMKPAVQLGWRTVIADPEGRWVDQITQLIGGVGVKVKLSQQARQDIDHRNHTKSIDRLNHDVNDHLEDFVDMEELSVITKDGYPTLSGMIDWDIVTAQFRLEEAANESLISNISIIPVVGEQYVMMQVDSGKWELAGGTLEPDEPYMDALKREVKEELGAELVSYTTIGHFLCHSAAGQPFRSHIPHPHFIRLVGYGEVNIVGAPLNPPDGETVIAVEVVPIELAVRRFEEIDRYDIAELYRLAHHLRMIKG